MFMTISLWPVLGMLLGVAAFIVVRGRKHNRNDQ